jgi:hypothetical protein
MLARQTLYCLSLDLNLFALVIFQIESCTFCPGLSSDSDPQQIPHMWLGTDISYYAWIVCCQD